MYMTEKKKTKKQLKEEAESQYVASELNITYTVPAGLAHLLANLSDMEVNEVWCILSELANVCAVRLKSRGTNGSSWTKKKFPNTDCELRIDMDKRTSSRWDKHLKKRIYDPTPAYYARFKINGLKTEQFTQTQVNDYITEKILLGDDEENTESQTVE